MYFNDTKENTNIDSEFKKKGFLNNFDFNKYKFFIIGGIIIIILLIVIILLFGKTSYWITLDGDKMMTMYMGDEYIEPGYHGGSNKNKNLTDKVVIKNNVDTSKLGSYIITYTLENTSVSRKVKVVEKPIGATTIYLKGDLTLTLKLNSSYKEPGYIVVDSIDSDLTDRVKIKNEIDTTKPGTYQIIYTVTNSAGITTSASRTIIVKK